MRTLVKICGIKSVDEARSVLDVGAKFSFCDEGGKNLDENLPATKQNGISFLGVIFAKSVRQISREIAREICKVAHEHGVKCVGVFGGQSDDEVVKICEFAGLDVAQIHEEISRELRLNLANLGMQIWQAISVKDSLPSVDFSLCDMALFDCKGENLGGNGVSFNWEILRELTPFSFGMAGGIGTQNVSEALKFKPYLVDINSKVEGENYVKEPEKVAEVLRILNFINESV